MTKECGSVFVRALTRLLSRAGFVRSETRAGRFWIRAHRLLHWVLGGLALLLGLLIAELAWDLTDPPPGLLDFGRASRRVIASDGRWMRVERTPKDEFSFAVGLDELSPFVVPALLIAEDQRFFDHEGCDFLAIARAFTENLREGRVVSGASTLTMQVARLLEPHPRSLVGKLIEARRARQLERRYSKSAILETYLNLAPFGGNLRGIEAAAQRYCGKRSRDLNANEAATLLALLPAPSRRAARRADSQLRFDRDSILRSLYRQGHLTDEAYAAAIVAPLALGRHSWPQVAPHACETLLKGSTAPIIDSSIDLELQARIDELAFAHDTSGVQGRAVIVLDRFSGALRALQGGPNDPRIGINYAVRRRSVGSTLKPFLFALAFDLGLVTKDTLLDDRPTAYGNYAPQNFGRTFSGRVSAQEALVRSRNVPAVQLLERVELDRFRNVLTELQLPISNRDLHLALALGTLEASPLELARAWQIFASEFELRTLSRASRRTTLSILASTTPHPDLMGPGLLSWKTGTSSNRRDAWCVGVTPSSVIVTWLGDPRGLPTPSLLGSRSPSRLLFAIAANGP